MRKRIKNLSATFGSSFIGQVLFTLGTAGVLNILGLLTVTLAARLLGPEGRGELATIQLWGTFFATLALLGLPEAVVYFTSRTPERAGQYWISGTCFALFTGLPVLLLGYWLLPWLLQAHSLNIVAITRWYSVGLFVLFALSWMPLSALRGLQQITEWNILRTLPHLGWLLILVLGFVLDEASLQFLAYGFLIIYAFVFTIILIVSLRKIKGPYLPKVELWPSMMRYGFPLMLSLIPTYLIQNGRLSQFFISAFLEPKMLGFFTVAIAWANISGIIPQAIGQITFPRVARGLENSVQTREIIKSVRSTILSVAGICSILLTTAPVAIPFLFGKDFLPAIPIAMVLVFAGGITGFKKVLSDILRGLGKPKIVLIVELVAVGTMALGLVLLIEPLGIIGAAFAILISEGISIVLLTIAVKCAINTSIVTLLMPTTADIQIILLLFKKSLGLIKGRKI